MKVPGIVTALWAIPLTVAYCSWALRRSYLYTGSVEGLAASNEMWFIPKYAANGTIFEEASQALTGAYKGFMLLSTMLRIGSTFGLAPCWV